MEIIEKVAAIAGAVISLVTLGSLIIKPVRTKIVNTFASKATVQQNSAMMEAMDQKLEKSLANDENILTRLDTVECKITSIKSKVLENEADRLRAEIVNCANRCRRNIPLNIEEYMYIQDCYQKYSDELHQNHIGTDNYNYIVRYFDNQNLKGE